jgi:TonB family protein
MAGHSEVGAFTLNPLDCVSSTSRLTLRPAHQVREVGAVFRRQSGRRAERMRLAHPSAANLTFPGMTSPRFLLVLLLAAAACNKEAPHKVAQAFQAAASAPDEIPKVLNTELPFRYPAALYERKVQGNVTLRLRLDTDGAVVADSTRVEEPSGHPALDTAAITGARQLRFVPAKLKGEAMPVTILFPVYFRHPEARALPGDSILKRPGSAPDTVTGT